MCSMVVMVIGINYGLCLQCLVVILNNSSNYYMNYYIAIYGIVIMTNSLLFQIQLDEWTQFITMWRTTAWQSFPHSQPAFLHIIIYTILVFNCTLICNKHDKRMVKMTILFLLWYIIYMHGNSQVRKQNNYRCMCIS